MVQTSSGELYLLNPNAYIDRIVITDGYYESEVRQEIESCAAQGNVLWDVGANFGLHCTSIGKAGPDLEIVAFEPNPAEHARLLTHRKWNAPKIKTCSLALSDRSGLLKLHLGPDGNSGMTTLSPWSEAVYSGIVSVGAVRGDDLVAAGGVPAPNVIKIDVEGHETEVLHGLAQTLRTETCHTVVFEDGTAADNEPKQLLSAAGFQITRLQRRERTAHALSNFVARKARAK